MSLYTNILKIKEIEILLKWVVQNSPEQESLITEYLIKCGITFS